MPSSLIQNLIRSKDTTVQAIREIILDHILSVFPTSKIGQTGFVPP